MMSCSRSPHLTRSRLCGRQHGGGAGAAVGDRHRSRGRRSGFDSPGHAGVRMLRVRTATGRHDSSCGTLRALSATRPTHQRVPRLRSRLDPTWRRPGRQWSGLSALPVNGSVRGAPVEWLISRCRSAASFVHSVRSECASELAAARHATSRAEEADAGDFASEIVHRVYATEHPCRLQDVVSSSAAAAGNRDRGTELIAGGARTLQCPRRNTRLQPWQHLARCRHRVRWISARALRHRGRRRQINRATANPGVSPKRARLIASRRVRERHGVASLRNS